MAPGTQYTTNGDVRIAYETFGDLATGEPLLLVMGLDFQMVWWPDGLCEMFADRGFAVVRFDNRDTGLSTHFESPRRQNPFRALLGGTKPVYTGADMLADALAVMDAVGWQRANVLGGSMGAGLAQGLAVQHPDRVKTLTSVMGLPVDSGSLKTLSYIRFGVFNRLRKIKPPQTPEQGVDNLVEIYRAIASPGYPFPEQWVRRTAEISEQRAPRDPKTTQRQLAAGRAQKSPPISGITAPTLVISGADDPLIKPVAGRDTAAKIPGARFVSYPGMGHNLPEELWPEVVDLVASLAGLD
jgi:pimeloyl-ACP methyl ester carboxylesterase